MPTKKKSNTKIVLTIFIALVVSVLLIPQVLHFEQVKRGIVSEVNSRLSGETKISKIRWSWFPVPHLTVLDVSFHNEQITLDAPAIRFYPEWKSFWGKELALSRIVLSRPKIVTRKLHGLVGAEQFVFQDKLKLIFDKGSLQVESQQEWPFTKSFKLDTFSATLTIDQETVLFDLISSPSFAGGLALKGSYVPRENSYTLNLYTERLRLHEAVAAIDEKGKVTPAQSEANLKARIIGKGLDEISAHIVGKLPSFLVKNGEDAKRLLSCGFADMSFVKKNDEFSIDINRLEIEEPGINLSGRVKRYFLPEENQARWLIDLDGQDINLTEIRDAVMTLWRDNIVTKTVTAIVLDGKAGSGSYKFDGTVGDFQNIHKMVISASNINAEIHVPEADLDLREAGGILLIKDGLLTLKDASARFQNSRGKNCNLLLGLDEDDEIFELDLDVEADLADLPETLLKLVPHEKFQQEVKKFSQVTGSATAHLYLGDKLSDISAEIFVKNILLHADHENLNWDFQVNGGTLQIMPNSVSWQAIKGSIGPHRVLRGNGKVQWEDGVHIEIDTLDAFVAAPALAVEDFSYYPEFKKMLYENIDFLDGILKLSNTKLSGPVFQPEKWHFETTVKLDGVSWESPFLPAPVITEKSTLVVNESSVDILNFEGRIFTDSMKLKGVLIHQNFSEWHGSLSLSGSVHEEFSQWIRSNDWIPPVFFPIIPCNVQDIYLDWNQKGFSLKGMVIPGEEIQERPRLELSYISTDENPHVLHLDIFGNDERGVLNVDFLDNISETISLRWQGAISSRTVEAIFADKNLLTGSIQGEININLSPNPAETYMEGDLKISKLRWYWVGNAFKYIVVDDLILSGKGKEAVVEKLTLNFNNDESVSMGGDLSLSAEGLKMDFDLTSPSLSLLTVVGFLSDLTVQKELVLTDEEPRDESIKSWTITGHVDFNITEFISGDKATPKNKLETSTLVWTPLVGSFVLDPQGRVVAEITSGRLCCLSATGKWYSDKTLGDSTFTLTSDCPEPTLFENILPCLGFKQDLIVGEFGINAKLKGQVNNWKSGSMTITSDQGRILRLHALSKILKVVNLTDLFTTFVYSDTDDKGFAYNELILETFVENNRLIIEKAFVKGEGLNLFARGSLDLGNFDTDIVVMIAPFKTLDAIVAKVPLVGRVVGGDNATLITIPVGIKGDIRDPDVTILPASAVGEGILSIVKNALMLPFHILSPILPDTNENGEP